MARNEQVNRAAFKARERSISIFASIAPGKSQAEALSVATDLAAIPPAMALGPGAESRIPMSVTIVGGVLVSTFFALFVVPCAYMVLSKRERRSTYWNRKDLKEEQALA